MSKYKYESAKNARARYNKKYYGKSANKYESRPWTIKEMNEIIDHKKTDTELSKELKRSVGAIQKKRYYINHQNKIVQHAQNQKER